MEWLQDCWLFVWDDETVGYFSVIDSFSVGGGDSPDPSIKGIQAWFYFVVYIKDYEPIGRKDGK